MLVNIIIVFSQFGDHLPRNISKAVNMLHEIAGKGSAVGQQVSLVTASLNLNLCMKQNVLVN